MGDRVSGWRVECPACGEPSLLPEAYARPGLRVRCPGCGIPFAAADPEAVESWLHDLEAWVGSREGGADAVRADRTEGAFWRRHGESLFALFEADSRDAAAFRAALARVLGPGPPLF